MDLESIAVWLAVVMTFASGVIVFFDSSMGNLCWYNETGALVRCAGSGILDSAQINTNINGQDINTFIASHSDLNMGGTSKQSSNQPSTYIPILSELGWAWNYITGAIFTVIDGIFKWRVVLYGLFNGMGINGLIDIFVATLAIIQTVGVAFLITRFMTIFKL